MNCAGVVLVLVASLKVRSTTPPQVGQPVTDGVTVNLCARGPLSCSGVLLLAKFNGEMVTITCCVLGALT